MAIKSKEIHQFSRLFTIGIIIVLFLSFSFKSVSADSGEDFDRRIDPGEYHFIDFSLSTGESIYVRFHVTYGEGIYFFIVDQDGHDDIMAGRAAETTYKEETYDAEDGQWRYIAFSAPHTDTWYVWFSKAYGAPLSDSAATIEGHARKDTDGPIIQEFSVSENPIAGDVEVHYKVVDLGYPIAELKLFANGTQVLLSTDPQQNHYTTGFEASGALVWDSTTSESGNYSLILVAYDSLGHSSSSDSIYVTVSNGWLDYLIILVLVIAIIITIALIIWYARKK